MNKTATIRIDAPKHARDKLAMFLNDLAGEGYETHVQRKPGTGSCLAFTWKGQVITVNCTSEVVSKFQSGNYRVALRKLSGIVYDGDKAELYEVPNARVGIVGNGVAITGALLAIKGEVMELASVKRATLPFTRFVVGEADGAEDGDEAQNS